MNIFRKIKDVFNRIDQAALDMEMQAQSLHMAVKYEEAMSKLPKEIQDRVKEYDARRRMPEEAEFYYSLMKRDGEARNEANK